VRRSATPSKLAFEPCLEKVQKTHALCLLAWEGAEGDQTRMSKMVACMRGESIAVFVGPEGGFSEDEARRAGAASCIIISLGQRILRMETAAIILPALVLHELGEL